MTHACVFATIIASRSICCILLEAMMASLSLSNSKLNLFSCIQVCYRSPLFESLRVGKNAIQLHGEDLQRNGLYWRTTSKFLFLLKGQACHNLMGVFLKVNATQTSMSNNHKRGANWCNIQPLLGRVAQPFNTHTPIMKVGGLSSLWTM